MAMCAYYKCVRTIIAYISAIAGTAADNYWFRRVFGGSELIVIIATFNVYIR